MLRAGVPKLFFGKILEPILSERLQKNKCICINVSMHACTYVRIYVTLPQHQPTSLLRPGGGRRSRPSSGCRVGSSFGQPSNIVPPANQCKPGRVMTRLVGEIIVTWVLSVSSRSIMTFSEASVLSGSYPNTTIYVYIYIYTYIYICLCPILHIRHIYKYIVIIYIIITITIYIIICV